MATTFETIGIEILCGDTSKVIEQKNVLILEIGDC